MSVMKKLIYISHLRYPSDITHSAFAMKTCESFASDGLDVELWVPRRKLSEGDPFEYHGVGRRFEIKRIPAIDLMYVKNAWQIPFLLLLFSYNISLVFHSWRIRHSAVFYLHDARDASLISFLVSTYVIELHDFYHSKMPLWTKRVLSRASALIVTTKKKIEKLGSMGIRAEKIFYQPNAVDLGIYASAPTKKVAREHCGIPRESFVALYTGHLYDWKGAPLILEAARLDAARAVQFYIVGGSDKDILSFRGLSAGLSNVHVLGRVPHREVVNWQMAADVLLLPNSAKKEESSYDTSPVKLFEYLASGVPIVASRIPAVTEIAGEDVLNFFEADNAASMLSAILELQRNSFSGKRRSIKGKVLVEAYSWNRRSRNILDFLRRCGIM
jgi:glycosyltransferase involved in cell wall biosynthesis